MKRAKTSNSNLSVFSIILFILLLLYVVSLIIPLCWALITSLKGKLDFIRNPFALPKVWEWKNYITAAENFTSTYNKNGVVRTVEIGEMLVNSLVYALGASFLGTFATCVMAYASSRFNFKMSKWIYSTVLVVMTLPIVGNLPSAIQVMRKLNLYDTMAGMLIMNAAFWGMHFLIFHAAFSGIPKDYNEAAYVDGASNWTVMVKIIFPLVINTFAPIMLIKFIGFWNDYNMTLQYAPNVKTLAFGLYEYSLSFAPAINGTHMKMAGCCILAVPVLILFLFFHKRIMGNIAAGGIKE